MESRLNSLLYVLHVFHPLPVCCMTLNLCLSEDCHVNLLVPVTVPVGVCVYRCVCLLYELYVSVSNKGPFFIFIEQLG